MLARQNPDWEAKFRRWAVGPAQTETERCERAVDAIKKAIAASRALAGRQIEVFAKGSYANRTNVRGDSDVDVAVFHQDTYFYDYPAGVTDAQTGTVLADYLYPTFRDETAAALVARFGAAHVRAGNKALNIHENTYRIDADAVPCFGFRQYYRYGISLYYHEGIALQPRDGSALVTSFPKQQYANGVAKNDATGREFKRLVRIVKNLRTEMAEAGNAAATPIPSYLIESLAWNYPNELFPAYNTWTALVKAFLSHIWNTTSNDFGCATYMEVNNIKPLFTPSQGWTRAQVNDFALQALVHLGGL